MNGWFIKDEEVCRVFLLCSFRCVCKEGSLLGMKKSVGLLLLNLFVRSLLRNIEEEFSHSLEVNTRIKFGYKT